MKKNYSFILACLLSVNAFISKAQAPIPDLIHYKFNGTGSLVTNYASTPPVGAATGTLLGALTQTGSIGCIGAGVGSGVAASTDYLNTGWVTSLPSTGWSISFWSSNVQPSATLYYIFGDATAGSFRCFTNGVAGPNNWILRGSGITDVIISGAATTTANMVTYVYNQTNSVITGYINGVQTVSVAQTGTPAITSTTGPFKVIGYATNVGLNAGGLLGDFRVYGSALTSTAVLAIYNETIATPTNSISGPTSICANQSATLTANGFASYLWNTSSTNTTIIVTPSVTTSYTVVGGTGSCTNTAISTITVNSNPTITVASGVVCAGNSFTLSPSGASTYTYLPAGPVVSPTATATYSIIGTNAAGCGSNTVATVTVNSLPTVSAASSTSLLCVGQTASLTASGASTYTWNTTANSTVIAVSPTVTTSYTVTGSGSNGCTNTFTISQAVSPCTGINAKTASVNDILVYPNPNTGVFTIELNNGSVKNIEVMDLTGRVILSSSYVNDKVDFNINTLANGVYYVRIQSNNAVDVIKIVKE